MEYEKPYQNGSFRAMDIGVASLFATLFTAGTVAIGAYVAWQATAKLTAEIQEAKQSLLDHAAWPDAVIKMAEHAPAILQNATQLTVGCQELAAHIHKLGGLHAVLNRDSPELVKQRTIQLQRNEETKRQADLERQNKRDQDKEKDLEAATAREERKQLARQRAAEAIGESAKQQRLNKNWRENGRPDPSEEKTVEATAEERDAAYNAQQSTLIEAIDQVDQQSAYSNEVYDGKHDATIMDKRQADSPLTPPELSRLNILLQESKESEN